MNIFKYFPYTKTVRSIIDGFRLHEDPPGGGGGDPSGGGKTPADPAAGKKTVVTLEDIPQDLRQEIFNMGFKKADGKAKGALEKKLLELGITDENLEKWKKIEEDAEKAEADNLLKKGEFDKLKLQMVDQHNTKIGEKDTEIKEKDSTIHQLVVRNQLIAEAAIECVNPTHVANLLQSEFKAEKIDGKWYAVAYKNGSKLIDDQGNPQTVKVFLENWLKIEENSYFKKSNVGQGGTGSRTGTGYQKTDGKIDKKGMSAQSAIKSGLGSGESIILNRKAAITADIDKDAAKVKK